MINCLAARYLLAALLPFSHWTHSGTSKAPPAGRGG